MISVVMATYNSTRYLLEQLDSILNQTVHVDEVILVDDCSSDNTVNLINDYISENMLENWKLYKHDVNRGYINTFRDALEKSNGDIVILCDHDDIWLNNKVALIQQTFDNNKSIMSLATKFIQIDEHGQDVHIKNRIGRANNNLIRKKIKRGTLAKILAIDVAVYNISPGCTCAVSRELINLYLLEPHKLPHDWELNILAACNDGLYYLDLPTTKYRIYSGNTIGLGHQLDFSKRSKIALLNKTEKENELAIVNKNLGTNSIEYNFYAKLFEAYKSRNEYMTAWSFFKWLNVFFQSLYFTGMYETVLMDLFSKIKG